MMADITFRQGDFEGALNLYEELVEKNPGISLFPRVRSSLLRKISIHRKFQSSSTLHRYCETFR